MSWSPKNDNNSQHLKPQVQHLYPISVALDTERLTFGINCLSVQLLKLCCVAAFCFSLFQHYSMYEFLFSQSQDKKLLGKEVSEVLHIE